MNTLHPYDDHSKIYNFFFHPLHFREIEMRVASIALNIFLTLVTFGIWQIPFWVANRLDDRKVEERKASSPVSGTEQSSQAKSGNQTGSKTDTLAMALKKIEAIPAPVCDFVLPDSFLLPKDTPLLPPSKAKKVGSAIHTAFGVTKIVLKEGAVVDENTQAVVNAANSILLGGSGVDGAFWDRSGTIIVKDEAGNVVTKGKPGEFLKSQILPIKDKLENKQLKTGGAVITRSINIPSPYIIHTVGPQGERQEALRNAYASCLKLLISNNLQTISFCCISQSIYGYSPQKAAPIVINLIRRFCEENPGKITEIRLIMFNAKEWKAYSSLPEFSI